MARCNGLLAKSIKASLLMTAGLGVGRSLGLTADRMKEAGPMASNAAVVLIQTGRVCHGLVSGTMVNGRIRRSRRRRSLPRLLGTHCSHVSVVFLLHLFRN